MRFAAEENRGETSLKLAILFYHPGHFRQAGWKGIYFTKEKNNKSSLPQIIKVLRSVPVSKAHSLKPQPTLPPAPRSGGRAGAEGPQRWEMLGGGGTSRSRSQPRHQSQSWSWSQPRHPQSRRPRGQTQHPKASRDVVPLASHSRARDGLPFTLP